MHILAGLLVIAVLAALVIGTLKSLLPHIIKFIIAASLAIVLVWLSTLFLPYSLAVWLIAAAAIAANRPKADNISQQPSEQLEMHGSETTISTGSPR